MSKTKPQTKIKERPIIMTAESVRAIMDGRKTQTRRVINPPSSDWILAHHALDCSRVTWANTKSHATRSTTNRYGIAGDHLWVRETFTVESGNIIHYRADGWDYDDDPNSGWTPSIFMHRYESRLTLEIASVRVERVQEISEEDAKAEGILLPFSKRRPDRRVAPPECFGMHVNLFSGLWDSINAKRGFSWESNPYVWCISFHKIKNY